MGSLVADHGLSCPLACRALVPGPGIKPESPELAGGWIPHHWTTSKVSGVSARSIQPPSCPSTQDLQRASYLERADGSSAKHSCWGECGK